MAFPLVFSFQVQKGWKKFQESASLYLGQQLDVARNANWHTDHLVWEPWAISNDSCSNQAFESQRNFCICPTCSVKVTLRQLVLFWYSNPIIIMCSLTFSGIFLNSVSFLQNSMHMLFFFFFLTNSFFTPVSFSWFLSVILSITMNHKTSDFGWYHMWKSCPTATSGCK